MKYNSIKNYSNIKHFILKYNRLYRILKYIKYCFTSHKNPDIVFVIGDCGSGKSSYAVRIAQRELKKGNPVYSNMYIDGAYLWDIDDFMIYDTLDNSTIIIDEASSKGLASRGDSYKQSNKSNVIEGFTMYRHYGVKRIIVIAPSFADVIPIVRSRTTKIRYICNPFILGRFGIGKYRILKKKIDIPMGSTEPVEVFKFIPFIRGFFFLYGSFKAYDSFSRRTLRTKKWKIYGDT